MTPTIQPNDPQSGPPGFEAGIRVSAQAQWAALADAVSGHQRMRVSRDGGKTYPRRYERGVSAELPNQPAAVLIYDRTGAASTFCVDLDVSRGGREAVERDLLAVTAILRRLRLPHFADRSPNGGVHVYVPLAEPAPHHEAAAAARALAARTPTMDPMPMLGIDSGCIRPPGARHKSGGHQELIDTMTTAMAAVHHPGTATAWAALLAELRPTTAAPGPPVPDGAIDATDNRLASVGRFTAPTAKYQHIARTGESDGYSSPSEARQAVLWACAASGWAFADVARRIEDGTWPGLASMYGRYRAHTRHGALVRDWQKAISLAKSQRETTRMKAVRVGPTSRVKTHAGSAYDQIRTWRNAAQLTRHGTQRDDLATRAVLDALAEAAIKTEATTVEFGNRSLAIATGLHERTVGKVLRMLEEEDRPLIDLTLQARGIRAHAWTLTIPDELADQVAVMKWRRGRINAVRPAFRELGLPAAFVYAALEQATAPTSGRDISRDAGLGHSAGHDALHTLAAFGLAQHTAAGWTIGTASLEQLAERFGVADQVAAQIQRYRDERKAWWARLGIIKFPTTDHGRPDYFEAPPPPDLLEPPPEPGTTLMDMLAEQLGAYIVDEQPAAAS